jgi:hypothetical protein
MTVDLEDSGELARRAPSYELAFEEAGRALDAQERSVNELRSRASVLIAAAAVTTSFFGGRVLSETDDQLLATWLAIGAFGAVGLAVLSVLWPRHDWEFSASATDMIAEYVEPESLPLALIHRDLALHRAASYVANARQLRWLFGAFRAGLVALVIEVVAWVVALTERT